MLSHIYHPYQTLIRRLKHIIVFFVLILLFFWNNIAGNPGNHVPGEQRTFPSVAEANSLILYPNGYSTSLSADTTVPDSITKKIDHILAVTTQVKSTGRLIRKLDAATELYYPVGISSNNGILDFVVALESDEITPEGAFIKAIMSFTPPNENPLVFESRRFLLSPGAGIVGEVELGLVNPVKIPLGKQLTLIIDPENTFAVIDCNGFKNLTISADLELSPDKFVPEDPVTGNTLSGTVKTRINTTIENWNDLIVAVTLPAFQIKGLKEIGFEINQAVFDMSDYSNPTGIHFPENYSGLEMFAGNQTLWQGIYIREMTVRLPAKLNEGVRKSVSGNHMIIDHLGFTGDVGVTNLLPNGSLGGWAYSIDEFHLGFIAGQLNYGGLNGYLQLPVTPDSDKIYYEAIIDQKGDFHFTAGMPESVTFDMWYADVTIDQSSRITVEEINNQFAAKAILHGHMRINAPFNHSEDTRTENNSQSKGFSVDGIQFQNLVLSSRAPHFQPGVWSVQSIGVNDLNGFSFVLDNIQVISPTSTDAGLSFTTRLTLSKKYYASASMEIMGSIGYENAEGNVVRQKWKYKHTKVHEIEIDIRDDIISLQGYLSIYRKHTTYGNGVYGVVNADIAGIGVSAVANFGKVDETRYWFVDALASSKRGLVNLGGISVYGIGGGAYYHMKQDGTNDITFTGVESLPSADRIGEAISGISYIPDKTISNGFKATVILGTAGTPRPFNANATFEIVFNSRGGVNNLAFYGSGYFMQDLDLTRTEISAPVYADVFLGMDFENKVLHGNFKVFVNLAGGIIRGINEGNLAGEVVMHFDPNDWYIHIGTPSRRVGLVMDIGILKIQNGSYFMVGTQIEPMPSPPQRVLDILDMTYEPNRELDELFTGKGFAFGSDFSFGFDASFLIFYASLNAGLGFDVMLADYREAYCIETNEQLGINGWYAQGQAYAYIEANIGIRVKVFGDKRELEILALGAATLLETKLPNPFWMRGTVGGYYRVLGGLVKGNCRFQFEVGKQCTVKSITQETSVVETLEVISELTPANGKTEVDVFNMPQAVFNYPVNKSFTIIDEEENSHSFRIILDKFEVSTQEISIDGNYNWNNQGDVIAFNSYDLLPGETKINLTAQIHFEEKTGSTWKPVVVNNKQVVETKEYSFETGKAPDYIPEKNIAFSYPLPGMKNFYRDEYSQGYIQLIKGQAYLFEQNDQWQQKGRYTAVASDKHVEFDYTYNASERLINYSLPKRLQLNTIYKLELVNIPNETIEQIDENIEQGYTKQEIEGGSDIEMQTKTAQGELTMLEEKSLYEIYMRTSWYNTLDEKLSDVSIPQSLLVYVNNVTFKLRGSFTMDESFDLYEYNGAYVSDPLIQFEASEEGIWLKEYQIPLIYDDYPIIPKATISNRNTAVLGLVPVKAVSVDMANRNFTLLDENEKYSGSYIPQSFTTYLNYNLSPYTYNDYHELVSILANSDATGPRAGKLLTTPYPPVRLGINYPIKVHYVLPGINKRTSTTLIKQYL